MQIETKFNIGDAVYMVGTFDSISFSEICPLCQGKETIMVLIEGQEEKVEMDCSCKNVFQSRSIFYNEVSKMKVEEIKIFVDWRKAAELNYNLIGEEDSVTVEEEYIFKTEREALEFCVRQNEHIVESAEQKGYHLKKHSQEKINALLDRFQRVKLNNGEE